MRVHVSPEINALLDDATALSVRTGRFYVGVEHIFEAILARADLLPAAFAQEYLETLHRAAQEIARTGWTGIMPPVGREVFYTPRCARITQGAGRIAQRFSQFEPGAGYLLLSILTDDQAIPSRVLDRLGAPRQAMCSALQGALASEQRSGQARVQAQPASAKAAAPKVSTGKDPFKPEVTPEYDSEGRLITKDEASPAKPPQASLTRDLTQLARQKELDKAIGRKEEIYQLIEILSRRNKSNVILVGEAGVGKTRIVEGLANKIVEQDSEGVLAGCRLLELNHAALMAGTQYRGGFEEKVLQLLEDLKKDKKTILFVDEIHLIMGAGATEGSSVDLANLLKPALARGEIRCIGATTLKEYRRFIEKDPALERRFQMVRVEELSPYATLEVLQQLKPVLEQHHQVRISRRALHSSITLTHRYMPDRHLPDKAIDVLDQACARYRLKLIAHRAKERRQPQGVEQPVMSEKVTPHDIRKVISRMTAIPIEDITNEERRRLHDLERRLKKVIIGQDEAVAKAVAAVKKSRAGLADPERPDAVMLFLGPTGVGKTQLCKSLARAFFGSSKHLLSFDMSEYTEAHSVSRLIGAPPGYVGHEEEGELVSAVRTMPFSLVLFDEIEKAHPRVYDILLPLLDEGRIRDVHGREISFRNTIVVFTSNIASELLQRPDDDERSRADSEMVLDELRKHFRPEFINRIDDIVPFYSLLFEDIRAILQLALTDIAKRLKAQEMSLRIYQGAYEYLAQTGYSPEYGARELRRTVDRLVATPISAKLLEGEFVAGDRIEVLINGDTKLTFRKGAPATDARAANA